MIAISLHIESPSYMVKVLTNLLPNQTSDDPAMEYYRLKLFKPICMTSFTARSTLVSYAFICE